ncbi:tyrosine-type recombinase/integrase [Xenorhabdus szentirmaii]|uniref:tyrosine-type recombinase/integrase n=1 Tax=Xenorhabdus szentirmaii TaxID=290112 RepID=UPI0019879F86|nr:MULTISPECIES: integrase arm-type DNA-binding domain-containing protein [unclassified Xenorhabdus]MBD2792018.1 tyrosine-type recombinase/integrase [Xenorhabdus sp. CUL]MBD2824316.1 tyrosine-type recombinase/integrase [Xenorhabdus sp. 5]
MSTGINKLSDKKLRALLGIRSDRVRKISDGGSLMIRVTKAGSIAWIYKYRLGGRESEAKLLTLGKYPDLSLAKAREMLDQCRTWLAEGKDPQRKTKLDRESTLKPVTVKEAIEYWLNEYVDENLVLSERYRERFEKHLFPHIGEIALSDCDTHYWLRCFSLVKKTAPSIAGALLQMSQQALKFCRVRRFAVSHVLEGITKQDIGVKQNKRKRVLTEKELSDFLKSINGNYYIPYYQNIFYLLIVFGARTVEIRMSKMDEWDLEQKLWTVPECNSKTREKIIRPIPDAIFEKIKMLKHQNRHSEYLLGELKDYTTVSMAGCRVWERLKHNEKWVLHDLRRTFATMLSDMGIAPHIVELLLGHTLGGILAVYNRSQYLPEKLDALNKWCERLDVLAGNYENVVILKAAQ